MEREFYRPYYHFSAPKGWMNDPNGLFYYKGKYHLCFQHNEEGLNWDIKSWGHAVSEDFFHWEYLPEAIRSGKDYAVFSGSAVVDKENVSGLKNGDDDPIILFFTAYPKGQMCAYSQDGGKSFRNYGSVLPNRGEGDLPVGEDRDPKVFFHKETGKWIMILYTFTHSRSALPCYGFFSSSDLLNWEYESEIENCFEMPDMFRLKVMDTDEEKWVVHAPNGDYTVGDFDGHRFAPCQKKNINARQYDTACPYTWNNTENRIIQVGWMYTDYDYSRNFKNFYTLPLELSLRKREGIYELLREPVREIQNIRKEIFSAENRVVESGHGLFDNCPMDCPEACEIDVEMEYNPFAIVALDTACGRIWYKSGDCSIQYNHSNKDLFFNARCAYAEPKEGIIKYKIFIDKTTVEIFADEGNVYMAYASKWKKQPLNMFSVGSPVSFKVRSLKIYDLRGE